jgi:RNA polymerase sigma-70 factor (ECF subfamily)
MAAADRAQQVPRLVPAPGRAAFFFGAVGLEGARVDAAAPDSEPGGDEALMLARLDQAVADRPPSLKEPLLLTAFDGRSHQEAAAMLKLTPKTVENRVRRARELLAGTLAASDAPPAAEP